MKTLVLTIAIATLLGAGLLIWIGESAQCEESKKLPGGIQITWRC